MLSPDELAKIKLKLEIERLENYRASGTDTGLHEVVNKLIEDAKKELAALERKGTKS
jgi:hypothetical protein